MYLKPTVKFGNKELAMAMAIVAVNDVMTKAGYEFVITSANDSAHSTNSKHYTDSAFDFRSKHIPTLIEKQNILTQVKHCLTADFDVLLENVGLDNEHFHLEYDKK